MQLVCVGCDGPGGQLSQRGRGWGGGGATGNVLSRPSWQRKIHQPPQEAGAHAPAGLLWLRPFQGIPGARALGGWTARHLQAGVRWSRPETPLTAVLTCSFQAAGTLGVSCVYSESGLRKPERAYVLVPTGLSSFRAGRRPWGRGSPSAGGIGWEKVKG